MFNVIKPEKGNCECGCQVYRGKCSYIPIVTWENFINNTDKYIQEALDNKDNFELFKICKLLDQ